MALSLDVKVVPQAGRLAWKLDTAQKLKCYLLAPAEKGKANQQLIDALAKALKIPKQKIKIVTGLTSRNKRIYIDLDISFDQVLTALGIERQISLF